MAPVRKRKRTSSSPPRGDSPTRAQPKAWVFPVLIILAGLVYLPSLDHPFFFDDYDSIIENEVVRGDWPLTRALFDPPPGPTAGRPIVCLSFVLNRVIGDFSESGYRLFNIALHVCCTTERSSQELSDPHSAIEERFTFCFSRPGASWRS